MRLSYLLVGIVILAAVDAKTSDFGVGVGGGTAGRNNLALSMAFGSGGWLASGYISGVSNSYYYQSDYYFSVNRNILANRFLWGNFIGFAGMGVYYSERALRSSTSGPVTEKVSDNVIGPSLRLKWNFLGPIYFAIDALYGFKNPIAHISLSFQDVEILSLGAEF